MFEFPPIESFRDLFILWVRSIISSIFYGFLAGIGFAIFGGGDFHPAIAIFAFLSSLVIIIPTILVIPFFGIVVFFPLYYFWMMMFGWSWYPFGRWPF